MITSSFLNFNLSKNPLTGFAVNQEPFETPAIVLPIRQSGRQLKYLVPKVQRLKFHPIKQFLPKERSKKSDLRLRNDLLCPINRSVHLRYSGIRLTDMAQLCQMNSSD